MRASACALAFAAVLAAGAGLARASSYLYVVGGNIGGPAVPWVHYAQVTAPGQIGPWQSTAPYPASLHYIGVASIGGFLYGVGGGPIPNGSTGAVHVGTVASNGAVASWATTTSYPSNTTRRLMMTDYSGGYLYAVPGSTFQTEERSAPAGGTSVGAWTLQTPLFATLGSPAGCGSGGYAVVYGVDGLSVVRCGTAALSGGSIGPWNSTQPVPAQVVFEAAMASCGGFVYLAGGVNNAVASPAVSFASVSAGALSPWAPTSPMPMGLYNHGLVAAEGYLWVIGGLGGGYRTEVYSAQILAGGALAAWTTAGNSLPTGLAYHGTAAVCLDASGTAVACDCVLAASPTLTETSSPTPPHTETATPSRTGTPSASATRTASATATGSETAVPTGSATGTASVSASASATASGTPSGTPTGSATSSASATESGTPTETTAASASRTASRTETGSPTRSETSTGTATRSGSATPTRTVSETRSPTSSGTSSGSATPTRSATPPPSASATRTYSATPPPSATASGTASVTETWSLSPSASATHTESATRTRSVTPVPPTGTATLTPTVAAARFRVDRNALAPPAEVVRIEFALAGGGLARLSVHNSAGERVRLLYEGAAPPWVRQEAVWDGTNQEGNGAAAGVYLVVLAHPTGRRLARIALLR